MCTRVFVCVCVRAHMYDANTWTLLTVGGCQNAETSKCGGAKTRALKCQALALKGAVASMQLGDDV